MSALTTIIQTIQDNNNISDLHLRPDAPITFRNNGDIVFSSTHLDSVTFDSILSELLQHHTHTESSNKTQDLDFSYISPDGHPFRVNIYQQQQGMAIAMRKISRAARSLDELMFRQQADAIREQILQRKKGLYLVTGATGSGKSTSLVAMLDHINQTRKEHIITIEDPIEFVYTPTQCLISQREIGSHTASFGTALKAAMREDPDIVLVGEIRDRETAESVLRLTESGHLVFSTLHTPSAALTINRFISFFPPVIHESISERLADVILGVQSQMLVKTADEQQRVGVYEIMLATPGIRNNIKKRDIAQINSLIETSASSGMISLRKYAEKLLDDSIIGPETYEMISEQLVL